MQDGNGTVGVNNLRTLLTIALIPWPGMSARNDWQSENGEYPGRQ